jgi:hypothetical protein
MRKTLLYIPVRKTDGNEWANFSDASLLADQARINAKKTDAEMPGWAKDNPVIRFGLFELIEKVL